MALQKHIGLTDSLSEENYANIMEKQMDENFTRLSKYYSINCSYAKYNLSAWNTKTRGDSFMYAVSIMSTVGMEIF